MMRGLFSKHKSLNDAEKFGIAVGGILTEGNDDPFDNLVFPYGKSDCREILSEWWSAKDRSELLPTLEWLMEEGHRVPFMNSLEEVKNEDSDSLNDTGLFLKKNAQKIETLSFDAWDYSRVVNVARWGFGAKYLNKDEAWEWIFQAAKQTQKSFNSWQETWDSYIMGSECWAIGLGNEINPGMVEAHQRLSQSKSENWLNPDWNTRLPD